MDCWMALETRAGGRQEEGVERGGDEERGGEKEKKVERKRKLA